MSDQTTDGGNGIVRYEPGPEPTDQPAEPTQTLQANPYQGIAVSPFPPESIEILMAPLAETDVEIRPDGLIYLPGIKYRRVLNRAFGPGAWALLPMDIQVAPADGMLYYKGALFVLGRFVSEAIGEQEYHANNDRMSWATAAESAKSNCLMRCCKDLGIASELWDPSYVRRWQADHAVEVWCVNGGRGENAGKKKKMWRKRSAPAIDQWPWKEEGAVQQGNIRFEQPALPERTPAQRETTEKPAPARQEATDRRKGGTITTKQVGRYRAIARSNGWTEAESLRLLASFGFSRAEDVTPDHYDRICQALEDVVMLGEIRADAENGSVAPDDLPF